MRRDPRRYEIATTADFRNVFEIGLECTTANYSLNADNTIRVDNSGSLNAPNGTRSVAIGTAKVVSGGKLEVTFAPAFLNIYSPYWIIGLYGEAAQDYSVALIYSCNMVLGTPVNAIWILSRSPVLPASLPYGTLIDKLESFGLDVNSLGLTKTVQVPSCVYA